MPASLSASVASAAASAKSDIGSQLAASFGALWAAILLKGRSLIDEPAEREAIETEAIQVFNGLFADSLGPGATLFLDAMVKQVIDRELVWLAQTPAPAPTPAVVTPPQPQGSAAP